MLFAVTYFIVTAAVFSGSFAAENECTSLDDIVKQLQWSRDVSAFSGGNALEVRVEFWIASITAVHITDAIAIENGPGFDAYIYVNVVYYDKGLAHRASNSCESKAVVTEALAAKVFWNPNLAFIGVYGAEYVKSPNRNTFTLAYANGTVWSNYLMKVSGKCAVDAAPYPLDVAQCSAMFESYTYNADQINLRWSEQHPVFLLREVNDVSNITATRTEQEYPAGRWDELGFQFIFARSILVVCPEKGLRKQIPYDESVAQPGGPCADWNKIGRYADVHVCDSCQYFQ